MSLVVRSALMIMSEIFVTIFIYILMLIASCRRYKANTNKLKIGKIYAILDCLKYNKTTSNKTIREKPLVYLQQF
jgi:hypothetical protein